MLGDDTRQDCAQVVTDRTTVCKLTLEEMQQLMKDDVSFALKIFRLIGLRINKLERKIDSLVFKDVRTRIVEFIREFVMEKGEKNGPE